MFYISPEDIPKISACTLRLIRILGSNNTKRVDMDISVGEDYSPLEASGYWTDNILRIDIKVKK